MTPRVKPHKKKKHFKSSSVVIQVPRWPFVFDDSKFFHSSPLPNRAPSPVMYEDTSDLGDSLNTSLWSDSYYQKTLAEKVEYVNQKMDAILELQAELLEDQRNNIKLDKWKMQRVNEEVDMLVEIYGYNDGIDLMGFDVPINGYIFFDDDEGNEADCEDFETDNEDRETLQL